MKNPRARLFLVVTMTALVVLLGGAGVAPVAAQVKKSDSVVKIDAKAGPIGEDGMQVVTLTLAIDKDWHLYANPVGNEDLNSAQTSVDLSADKPLGSVSIDYPVGKLVKDSIVGDYFTYEDKVTIKAKVKRASGDTGPLTAILKFQACTKNRCLLPAEVSVSVK